MKDDMFGSIKLQRPNIKMPKDKGILLKDILETDVDEKYYLSEERLSFYLNNSEKMKRNKIGFSFSIKNENEKAFTVTTKEGNRMENNFIYQPPRGFNNGGNFYEKTPTLTANSWQENNLLVSFLEEQEQEEEDVTIIKIDINGNPKKNQDKASCFTAGGQ
jgi:hypothetical protein